jgi:hypothetical protein
LPGAQRHGKGRSLSRNVRMVATLCSQQSASKRVALCHPLRTHAYKTASHSREEAATEQTATKAHGERNVRTRPVAALALYNSELMRRGRDNKFRPNILLKKRRIGAKYFANWVDAECCERCGQLSRACRAPKCVNGARSRLVLLTRRPKRNCADQG